MAKEKAGELLMVTLEKSIDLYLSNLANEQIPNSFSLLDFPSAS